MRNSDVFNEFVKIAKEKGLISEGEAEHTEQNTKNPRWDSLDLSAIEALYGVKPDLPKGMEYEHNIMEDAHPNAMVISPSYDKLHGLVENEIERQNINMHIIYKEPESGSPNQSLYPMRPTLLYPNSKYAEKDLLLALVRVANDMDNKNQDGLRVLADTCLRQVHQGLTKQAIIPWLIAAAFILGTVYMQQHLPDVDQGLRENFDRLQSELGDFLHADTTLGFGHKYDEALQDGMKELSNKLADFWRAYLTVEPLITEMERPHTAQDLAASAQHPHTQTVMQAYEVLRTQATDLLNYLEKVEMNFNNPDYKAEHTVEKGAITSLLDKVPFLHGGKTSLTADDFDDVVNAMSPFKASVKRLLDLFSKARDLQEHIKSETSTISGKTESFLGPDASKPSPEPTEKSVKDIDEESSGIEKSLRGLTDFIPGLGG